MHIYRWDLDKTYLDTDIESVRGLIRTALESARDKQTLPGAAELIRQITKQDPTAKVHILSGSPKQLRPVIEEKLRLDGVKIAKLTLKDNLSNIRRGRLRDVRGQLGYKLPKLLQQRVGVGARVGETLFGDDSEVDALVYAVYADVLSGKLKKNQLSRILEAGGAYSDSIETALEAASHIEHAQAVQDIFIYVSRGLPLTKFALLGDRVTPVFSWIQAALTLYQRKCITEQGLLRVIASCVRSEPLDNFALTGLFQDSLRRRIISTEAAQQLFDNARERLALSNIETNLILRTAVNPKPASDPDYFEFLRACR